MTSYRRDTLSTLREQPVDLLVVGGGIIGAGIARDAALRGLKVALVEKEDFAWGTTSRPTRLIHGGLRYLEMYDFGLVREDLHEREILLRVAPHLVFPLPFLMPMYERDLFYQGKLRAGMILYDVLSFDKSLPTRRWLGREETLTAEPTLKPDGLQGAWRYYDAQVPFIERFVVENALDAAASGALILPHARAERFTRDESGRVTGAVVRDLVSGEEVQIRAQLTVNATGPWLDFTDGQIRPGKPPLLRLTKGVHLVTPSGTRHAHVLFAKSDGRLFFVIPWLGYSLVGTTDTDYEGDPGDAAPTSEDVDYLIEEARRAFPTAPFDEIFYTWAGVRALVRVEGVKEGQVSRKHKVLDHETREGVPGIVSVVGGKITAYRGIAEEVVDLATRKLGRRAPGYTSQRPFPGGHLRDIPTYVERELGPRARDLGLEADSVDELAHVYGTLAEEVLDLVAADRSLGQRVCEGSPTILAQLVRATEREWATTLGDVLLRRTPLGLRPDQALTCAPELAEQLGSLLGWDAGERAAQVEAYQQEVALMRLFSRAVTPTPASAAR